MDFEGSTLPIDKLTKVFFKIKEKREILKAAFDSEDRELEAKQNKIKTVLLDHLKATGQKSGKTEAGTFYRSVKQRYWTNDWESMHKFVLEEQVPEFFEKRLHQGAVKQFLEDNPEKLPKGL